MLPIFKKNTSKFTKFQKNRLIKRLKLEEGFSPISYFDIKQWTWGYGTKAPGPTCYISKHEAEIELVKAVKHVLKEYTWIQKRSPFTIDEVRREALAVMLFNMGFPTFKKFKKTLALIFNNNKNDWHLIANEVRNSLWYNQVGDRAKRIYYELNTGKFYEENKQN